MSDPNQPNSAEEARRRAEAEQRQGMGPANTNNWRPDVAQPYNDQHSKK